MATPLGTAANGTVVLDEPNPNGKTRALLARDQNHLGRGSVVMRPSALMRAEPLDGSKKATRDNADMVDPETLGLTMQPIMIQRGEDAPLEPAQMDGTAASMERHSAEIRKLAAQDSPLVNPDAVTTPEARAAETKASSIEPVGKKRSKAAPAPAATPVTPATPSKRVRVRLDVQDGGRFTVFCKDLVVTDTLVVLVFPVDGTSAIVEPAKGDVMDIRSDAIQGVVSCVSNDMSFERGDELFVVLLRVPAEG